MNITKILKSYLLNFNKENQIHFIAHYKISGWGSSIRFMSYGGNAFGRMYWFKDDRTTIYLDELSVGKASRRKGIGTTLQIIREQIGIKLGATTVCLEVDKNSWMHGWYIKRGYTDYANHQIEPNWVWMKKTIG